MHDPEEAAKEARRAIKEFGFVGIVINDFQQYTDKNRGKCDPTIKRCLLETKSEKLKSQCIFIQH
jgi:predicted TIM-barrel fold metal-dependent hydrolase